MEEEGVWYGPEKPISSRGKAGYGYHEASRKAAAVGSEEKAPSRAPTLIAKPSGLSRGAGFRVLTMVAVEEKGRRSSDAVPPTVG